MIDKTDTPMKSPNKPPQFPMKSTIPNSSDLSKPTNSSPSITARKIDFVNVLKIMKSLFITLESRYLSMANYLVIFSRLSRNSNGSIVACDKE